MRTGLCLLLVSTGPGFPAAAAQLHQDVAAAGSSRGVASLGCGHQHHQKQGHYVNWAKCCKIRDDILVFYCPALPDWSSHWATGTWIMNYTSHDNSHLHSRLSRKYFYPYKNISVWLGVMSRVTPRHNILSNPLHSTGASLWCGWMGWLRWCAEEKLQLLTRALSIKHSMVLAWPGEVIKCIHQTQISALRIF